MVKKISRKKIILAGLLLSYGILAIQLLKGLPSLEGRPVDFVTYWAVSRLISTGGNPYSFEQMFYLQNQLGFGYPLLIPYWYPPWVITILLPFGIFDYLISRFLWIILSIIILAVCAITLWRFYNGPPNQTRWAGITVLFLSPTIFSLMEGQVSTLMLLGLVGFLYFGYQDRWFMAGLSAVLISIKPQLLYLFWLSLFFWILKERQWKVLAGFIIGCSIGTLIPILFNQRIVSDFLMVLLNDFPRFCNNMTIGSIICTITGQNSIWFSIIPPLLGMGWLGYYWVRNKEYWSWQESIPWIILVSLITTPFAWMHDGLIMAIPVMTIFISLIKKNSLAFKYWVVFYFLVNILAFLLIPSFRTEQYVFYWLPWIFLSAFYIIKKDLLLKNFESSPITNTR